MSTFSMLLLDSTHAEVVNGITSFVGEDSSGSFGLKAGHARMMATLSFGLARFCTDGDAWQYLALPGALLYFRDNKLTLTTRHYVLDEDYTRISSVLREQLLAEEAELKTVKDSLRRMEEEALRRLWRLGQART